MDFRIFLFLSLFLLCAIDDIHARRYGGSSRSSGRSYSSGSRSKSSGTSSTSHHTTSSHNSGSGGYKPTNYGSNSNTYGTSGGSSSAPHGQTSSTSHGTSFGTHTSMPHGQTSSTSHGTSTGTQIQHQQNKDITTSFLNAEGGGATRPGTTHTSNSGGVYGPQTPGQYGKPGVVTDSKQTSSPYAPSAPTLDYAPKTSSTPLQNGAPNTFGNPSQPWSNPHFNTNPQPSSGSQQPHIGFTDYSKNTPNSPHPTFPPYPSNPPYPTNPLHPTPHVSHSSYPYHRGHSHMSNTSTSHVNQQPFGGYGSYPQPMPPTMPGHHQIPPYSNPYGQPSQTPMWNPYSTHPVGSPYAAPGPAYYPQQQHHLAQPAAQPFVPGQTIIMVPGQQDSGRGLGQIFKEALVFSTVNAGVNRLLNPHHHYVSESRPDSGTTSTTTHITYNNQYFNTVPGSNGTMDSTNVPQGGLPGGSFTNYQNGGYVPSNMPTGGMPPSSGNANFANTQPGNTNYPNTPSTTPTRTGNNAGPIPSSETGAVGRTTAGNAAGGGTSSTIPQSNGNNPEKQSNGGSVNPLLGYKISDNDLYQITEELFAKDTFNVMKYITLNIQNHATSPNITDEAKEPLFTVQPEIFDHPTIYVTRALYDNYEHDSRKKENRTLEKRHEENLLIDTYLNTNVMATAMKWLSDHSFIDPDDFEKQDILRHVWFNNFDGTTSGFERVFTSEKYADVGILGVQDWNYFEYLETQKRINYMGYVDKLNLGDRASLLKLNFQMDEIVRPNATIFIGTLPELEMSLYTICFYARPNNLCPVSLGGTKFNIFTHSFRHFGYDLIDLALPVF